MRWCVVLAVFLYTSVVARAATIGLVGTYNSQDISAFLTGKGYAVRQISMDSVQPVDYSGLAAAIIIRPYTKNGESAWLDSQSEALQQYVSGGGRVITESSASIWALNTANLLAASDTGGDASGASRFVTFTEDGKNNVGKGMGSPSMESSYTDPGRTDWFRHLALDNGSAAKVLATQNAQAPAIIGGAYGKGNVVIIGYNWADSLSPTVGAPTQKLLLNAIRYEAVPLPAAVWGGLSLLGVVAGRTMWRRRGRRLNGERTV